MHKEISLNQGWVFHKGDIDVPFPASKGAVYSQSKTERKLFLLQDPVGLYKQDKIDMVPNKGAEITFDPKTVGTFEELLTWAN